MPTFHLASTLPASADALYDWHARPGAFVRLAPPWERMRVLRENDGLGDGTTLVFEIRKGPLRIEWEAVHEGHERGRRFVDRQARGPAASWVHTHRFEPDGDGSVLDDSVEWAAPFGLLGRLAEPFASRQIARLFRFRHARTGADLARHAPHASQPRLRVAISGASGLVGSALAAFLTTGGHEVIRLVRREAGPGEARWDPERGVVDVDALEGLDAVVGLAGEPIAQRWTAQTRRRIIASRVDGTHLLATALAGLDRPPRVFVSASAIGLYGDRGEARITEDSPPGEGFLAEVGVAWEAAAHPARAAGIRVVHPRIGIVIDGTGGMIGSLRPLFGLGLGGPVGNGRQGVSWIALDDLVGLLHHALWDDGLAGPVNATAPTPVAQRDLARVLGRVLRRPALAPAPAPALRLLYGQMAEEALLGGAFVYPQVALGRGFRFRFETLEPALRWSLGR